MRIYLCEEQCRCSDPLAAVLRAEEAVGRTYHLLPVGELSDWAVAEVLVFNRF
jgi:hypothetical protein